MATGNYMGSFAQGFIEAYLRARRMRMQEQMYHVMMQYYDFRMKEGGYDPATGKYDPTKAGYGPGSLIGPAREHAGTPGDLKPEGGTGAGGGAPAAEPATSKDRTPDVTDKETIAFFGDRAGQKGLHTNLDSNYAPRLMAAVQEAEAATGSKATFESYRRTHDEQVGAYGRYLRHEISAAAPPDQSKHQYGDAADMSSGAVLNYLHEHPEILDKHGLEFLPARLNDPGHIQLKGPATGQFSQADQPYQVAGPWEPPPGETGAALQQSRAAAFPAEQHRIITDPDVARAWPGPPITSTPPHTPTPIPGSQQGPESPYMPPDLSVYSTRPPTPSDAPSSGVAFSAHDSRAGPPQQPRSIDTTNVSERTTPYEQAIPYPPPRPKDLGATPRVADVPSRDAKTVSSPLPPRRPTDDGSKPTAIPPVASPAFQGALYTGMPVGGRSGGHETPTGMVGGEQRYTAQPVPLFKAPPTWTKDNPPVKQIPPPNLKVGTAHPGEQPPIALGGGPGNEMDPKGYTGTPAEGPPADVAPAAPAPATPTPTQAPAPAPASPDTGHTGTEFAGGPPPMMMPPPGGDEDPEDKTDRQMMAQMAYLDQPGYAIPPMMYGQHGGPVPPGGAPSNVQNTTNQLVSGAMGSPGQTPSSQSSTSGPQAPAGLKPSDFASPSLLNPSGNQALGMANWGGFMPQTGGAINYTSTMPMLQAGGSVHSKSTAIPRRPHLDMTRKGFMRTPLMQGGGPMAPQRPEQMTPQSIQATQTQSRPAATTYGTGATPGVALQGGGDPSQAGTQVPSEQPSFVSQPPVVTSDQSVAGLQQATAAGQSMMGSAAAHEGDLAGQVHHDVMRHKLQSKMQDATAPGQTSQEATQSPIGQFMNQIPFVQQMEQFKTQMASWPTIFNPTSAPQSPSPMFRRGGAVYRLQAGGPAESGDDEEMDIPEGPEMTDYRMRMATPGSDQQPPETAIPPEGSYQVASLGMMNPSAGVRIPHMGGGMGGGGWGPEGGMGLPRPRMGTGGTRGGGGTSKFATPTTELLPEGYHRDNEGQPVAVGVPQISDDQGNPSRGVTNAVIDGLGWIMHQVTGTSGIPQQGAQFGDLAPSDQQVSQIHKSVDPEDQLSDGMKNLASLEAVHQYYLLNGRDDLARQYAGMMLMYSRELAAKYGNVALQHLGQKNYDAAVQAEIEAGNIIPNGAQYTAVKAGDGTYTLQERNLNNKLLWEQQIGPREIMAAALGLQSGIGFWTALQRFGAQYDPESQAIIAAKDKSAADEQAGEVERRVREQIGGGLQGGGGGGGGGPAPGPGGPDGRIPVNTVPSLGDTSGQTDPDTNRPLISPNVNPAAGTGGYTPSNLGGQAQQPQPQDRGPTTPQPGPPAAPPGPSQETAIPPFPPYQVAGADQPPPTQPQGTPRVTPDVSQAVFGSPAAATGGGGTRPDDVNMPVVNTARLIALERAIQQRYFDMRTGDPLIGGQPFRKPNTPVPTGNKQVDNIANTIYKEQMAEWSRTYQWASGEARAEFQATAGGYRADIAQQRADATARRSDIAAARLEGYRRDTEMLKQKAETDRQTRQQQVDQEKAEAPLDDNYTIETPDPNDPTRTIKMSGHQLSENELLNAFTPPDLAPDVSDADKAKAQKKAFSDALPSITGRQKAIAAVDDIVRYNHKFNAVSNDLAAGYVRQFIGASDQDFRNYDIHEGPGPTGDKTDTRVEVNMRDETGEPTHFVMSSEGFKRMMGVRAEYIRSQQAAAKKAADLQRQLKMPIRPTTPSGQPTYVSPGQSMDAPF